MTSMALHAIMLKLVQLMSAMIPTSLCEKSVAIQADFANIQEIQRCRRKMTVMRISINISDSLILIPGMALEKDRDVCIGNG